MSSLVKVLCFLGENKFNSYLRRVQVVSVTSNEDRYYITYFLRPENEMRFKDKYIMFAEPGRKEREVIC